MKPSGLTAGLAFVEGVENCLAEPLTLQSCLESLGREGGFG